MNLNLLERDMQYLRLDSLWVLQILYAGKLQLYAQLEDSLIILLFALALTFFLTGYVWELLGVAVPYLMLKTLHSL